MTDAIEQLVQILGMQEQLSTLQSKYATHHAAAEKLARELNEVRIDLAAALAERDTLHRKVEELTLTRENNLENAKGTLV